ncbi:MAG: insulinase family protein [Myxococcales bacterium]|nr:insulinase family protein [Myxococcales bacterium]
MISHNSTRIFLTLVTVIHMTGFGVSESVADVAPLAVPPVQEFVLDNGLVILVFENHQIPYAAFRFMAKSGSIQDPSDKAGVASMMTTLLTYGTKKFTEQQINDTIDGMGASLQASSSSQAISVYGDVTTINPANVESFFTVFADVVRNPVFPEDAVERVKKRQLGALAQMKDNTSSLADRAMYMLLFEGHPFGDPTSGHPATISALTKQDIVDCHRRYVIPEHSVLGVAGDVNPETIVALAKQFLGDLSWGENCPDNAPGCGKRVCVPGELPNTCAAFVLGDKRTENNILVGPKTAPKQPESGLRIVIVDKQDASLSQVQWRMGRQNTVTYHDPDWATFRLTTQLLGGDFTSRLNQILRVREGLTYGARLSVSHGSHLTGPIAISTYVKPGDLRRAVELTLIELEKIRNEEPDQAELESFQSKIIESLPFRFETAQHILSEHMELRADNMPVSFLEQFPVAIANVNTAKVKTVAQKTIPVDGLLLVAVANADLADSLRPLVESRGGTVEVIGLDWLFKTGTAAP